MTKKIDFENIVLDYSKYPEVEQKILDTYGQNNGCILHPHWIKDSKRDFVSIASNHGAFRSLSWLGGGYPEKTDYVQPYEDRYHFCDMFANLDTIDVQSGMYQFYQIEELYNKYNEFPSPDEGISVLEIGGGYGRLAMFFLAYFGENCHYVSVDFAPSSLLFAPQVIRQLFLGLRVGQYDSPKNLYDYHFYSLPAWETGNLFIDFYDQGINIHSFQEMDRRSVDFYKGILWESMKPSGMLYVVNNPPEKDGWYTNHNYYNLGSLFKEFYSQKYPIGADWEKICGVPTLERAFLKNEPDIADTLCEQCGHIYAITKGDVESICPNCTSININ
jgi:SAM-dependent methyltransferase